MLDPVIELASAQSIGLCMSGSVGTVAAVRHAAESSCEMSESLSRLDLPSVGNEVFRLDMLRYAYQTAQ